MKRKIDELISNYECVGHNSIIYGDGSMILLDIEFYSKDNYFFGPIADTTLASYLKYNSEYLSSFDVLSIAESSDYKVLVGDSSSEENGIIYVTRTKDNTLLWFGFFEESDPFKGVVIDENKIIKATTASRVTWCIPIDNPVNINLIYP